MAIHTCHVVSAAVSPSAQSEEFVPHTLKTEEMRVTDDEFRNHNHIILTPPPIGRLRSAIILAEMEWPVYLVTPLSLIVCIQIYWVVLHALRNKCHHIEGHLNRAMRHKLALKELRERNTN
jgi:hypothetical protein